VLPARPTWKRWTPNGGCSAGPERPMVAPSSGPRATASSWCSRQQPKPSPPRRFSTRAGRALVAGRRAAARSDRHPHRDPGLRRRVRGDGCPSGGQDRGVGAGGQVVMSSVTADLATAELPDGVVLRDLGGHRLKDITAPGHLFEATMEGLPADFPPPGERRRCGQPARPGDDADRNGRRAGSARGDARLGRRPARHPHRTRRQGQDPPPPSRPPTGSWGRAATALQLRSPILTIASHVHGRAPPNR
jgi:hypothetical protein